MKTTEIFFAIGLFLRVTPCLAASVPGSSPDTAIPQVEEIKQEIPQADNTTLTSYYTRKNGDLLLEAKITKDNQTKEVLFSSLAFYENLNGARLKVLDIDRRFSATSIDILHADPKNDPVLVFNGKGQLPNYIIVGGDWYRRKEDGLYSHIYANFKPSLSGLPPSIMAGYLLLVDAPNFGFKGVSMANASTISSTDGAVFATLVKQKNARQIFSALYSDAPFAGKLYAALYFYYTDRSEYERLKSLLLKDESLYFSMNDEGVFDHPRVEEAIRRIENGMFEDGARSLGLPSNTSSKSADNSAETKPPGNEPASQP